MEINVSNPVVEFNVTKKDIKINLDAQLIMNDPNNNGDMLKNTYDTNFNGLVDTCEYVDGGTF